MSFAANRMRRQTNLAPTKHKLEALQPRANKTSEKESEKEYMSEISEKESDTTGIILMCVCQKARV